MGYSSVINQLPKTANSKTYLKYTQRMYRKLQLYKKASWDTTTSRRHPGYLKCCDLPEELKQNNIT